MSYQVLATEGHDGSHQPTPYDDLVWGGDASTLYVLGFDNAIELFTFEVTAAGLAQKALDTDLGDFTGVVEAGGPLIRWGDSGLAFVTYEDNLLVVQGSFVNPGASP